MKNKGLGLIGILISIAIIFAISSGFYYLNTTNEEVEDSGGVQKILNEANKVTEYLEENNKNISKNLNEIIKLQLCPDVWIDNQMPGDFSEKYQRQYFILNEKRRELEEFDFEWVQENCNLEKQIVY